MSEEKTEQEENKTTDEAPAEHAGNILLSKAKAFLEGEYYRDKPHTLYTTGAAQMLSRATPLPSPPTPPHTHALYDRWWFPSANLHRDPPPAPSC